MGLGVEALLEFAIRLGQKQKFLYQTFHNKVAQTLRRFIQESF